jgi:hypothetical protein
VEDPGSLGSVIHKRDSRQKCVFCCDSSINFMIQLCMVENLGKRSKGSQLA